MLGTLVFTVAIIGHYYQVIDITSNGCCQVTTSWHWATDHYQHFLYFVAVSIQKWNNQKLKHLTLLVDLVVEDMISYHCSHLPILCHYGCPYFILDICLLVPPSQKKTDPKNLVSADISCLGCNLLLLFTFAKIIILIPPSKNFVVAVSTYWPTITVAIIWPLIHFVAESFNKETNQKETMWVFCREKC